MARPQCDTHPLFLCWVVVDVAIWRTERQGSGMEKQKNNNNPPPPPSPPLQQQLRSSAISGYFSFLAILLQVSHLIQFFFFPLVSSYYYFNGSQNKINPFILWLKFFWAIFCHLTIKEKEFARWKLTTNRWENRDDKNIDFITHFFNPTLGSHKCC